MNDDPNKQAKEAFKRLLDSGELNTAQNMPSKLAMQLVIWKLEQENRELRNELERQNKTRAENSSRCGDDGRGDDNNFVEGKSGESK